MFKVGASIRFRTSFPRICLVVLPSIVANGAFAQFIYTPFDAPGASPTGQGTFPGAINNNGEIAGVFLDSAADTQGFFQSADGTFTVFSLPQACDGNDNCSARITGLNDLGEMVGFITSSYGVQLDFLRDQMGNYSTLSGPPGVPLGTVQGLTNAGETIEQPFNPGGLSFLRTATGTFTQLAIPPGFTQAAFEAINNEGLVAGWGIGDGNTFPAHPIGFTLNLTSSQFTYFDYAPQSNFGTFVFGLNDSGAVLGQINLDSGQSFVRSPDGSTVQYFVPAVTNDANQPIGINQQGIIVGEFQAITFGYPSRGYIGVPTTDTTPPSISLLGVAPGPPAQASFSVVDPIAGLFSVQTQETNATVTVAPFNPGQTTPVTVTATKIDQSEPATIAIAAEDTAGLVTDFDPAFATVYGEGGPQASPLSDIPPGEHVLTVTNGKPGLVKLYIQVNARSLVVDLTAGETRTLNLRAWMTLKSNTVGFSGDGPDGSQASVLLKDAATQRSSK
jgi:hypothetical protein